MNKYFFDHIPKTGGTALNTIFQEILGSDNVSPLLLFKRLGIALQDYEKYQLVQGHFTIFPGEHLDKSRFSITLLRNPIDRCLSYYYFNLYDVPVAPGKQSDSVRQTKFLPIEKYIESTEASIIDHIKNYQTHHFSQFAWDGFTKVTDSQQLNFAKESLNLYDLVGVYHQFDDFLDILCYLAGWPPFIKKTPHVKVTSKRPKLSEVDSKIIRRLEELNQLDIALYEYATQLFNEKKRQVLRECIERRHRELKAHSTPLSPSPPTPLPEGEGSFQPPVPLPDTKESSSTPAPADFGNRQLEILAIEVNGDISLSTALFSGETIHLRVLFRARIDVDDLTVGIHIHDRFGRLAYGVNSECLGHALHVRAGGVYFIDYGLRNDLGMGEYTIGAALHLGGSHLSGCFHWRDEVARFEVVGNIGYHFEGVAKLYPQLRCGVLEGDPAGIQAPPAAHDWPRLQHIAIHTPPLTEFNARLRLPEPPQRLPLHQVISVEAEITNVSSQTWGSTGQRPVHLSYHWQAPDGGWLEFDGERTPLPRDLAPGETIRHFLIIKAPPQPGPARLHLTLVQEGVGWFDQHGCPALIIPVSIEE